jgi:hypothetical protein
MVGDEEGRSKGKFFIGYKKTYFNFLIGLKFYFLLIILVLKLKKNVIFTSDNIFVFNLLINHEI